MNKLQVINPNSNSQVTAGIAAALDPLRTPGLTVETINLQGTPSGIESQADVDESGLAVAGHISSNQEEYGAFVIACFSDPGLWLSRESSRRPVFGIAATGMLSALSLGQHPGVISILTTSIPRHWRLYRSMGIAATIAGDVAIDTPVDDLIDEDRVLGRMLAAGRALRDSKGADVLVLGCAGMARYRDPLETELDMPVVDPTQATVGVAITALRLGWSTP